MDNNMSNNVNNINETTTVHHWPDSSWAIDEGLNHALEYMSDDYQSVEMNDTLTYEEMDELVYMLNNDTGRTKLNIIIGEEGT